MKKLLLESRPETTNTVCLSDAPHDRQCPHDTLPYDTVVKTNRILSLFPQTARGRGRRRGRMWPPWSTWRPPGGTPGSWCMSSRRTPPCWSSSARTVRTAATAVGLFLLPFLFKFFFFVFVFCFLSSVLGFLFVLFFSFFNFFFFNFFSPSPVFFLFFSLSFCFESGPYIFITTLFIIIIIIYNNFDLCLSAYFCFTYKVR